jgi:hypothetical protein
MNAEVGDSNAGGWQMVETAANESHKRPNGVNGNQVTATTSLTGQHNAMSYFSGHISVLAINVQMPFACHLGDADPAAAVENSAVSDKVTTSDVTDHFGNAGTADANYQASSTDITVANPSAVEKVAGVNTSDATSGVADPSAIRDGSGSGEASASDANASGANSGSGIPSTDAGDVNDGARDTHAGAGSTDAGTAGTSYATTSDTEAKDSFERLRGAPLNVDTSGRQVVAHSGEKRVRIRFNVRLTKGIQLRDRDTQKPLSTSSELAFASRAPSSEQTAENEGWQKNDDADTAPPEEVKLEPLLVDLGENDVFSWKFRLPKAEGVNAGKIDQLSKTPADDALKAMQPIYRSAEASITTPKDVPEVTSIPGHEPAIALPKELECLPQTKAPSARAIMDMDLLKDIYHNKTDSSQHPVDHDQDDEDDDRFISDEDSPLPSPKKEDGGSPDDREPGSIPLTGDENAGNEDILPKDSPGLDDDVENEHEPDDDTKKAQEHDDIDGDTGRETSNQTQDATGTSAAREDQIPDPLPCISIDIDADDDIWLEAFVEHVSKETYGTTDVLGEDHTGKKNSTNSDSDSQSCFYQFSDEEVLCLRMGLAGGASDMGDGVTYIHPAEGSGNVIGAKTSTDGTTEIDVSSAENRKKGTPRRRWRIPKGQHVIIKVAFKDPIIQQSPTDPDDIAGTDTRKEPVLGALGTGVSGEVGDDGSSEADPNDEASSPKGQTESTNPSGQTKGIPSRRSTESDGVAITSQ